MKIKMIDFKKIKFNRKTVLIFFAILIVGAVLIRTTGNIQRVLFKKKPDIGKKAPAITFEEETAPVKAYKTKKVDFKDTLPVMGNIKGFKEVDLKFQVSGVIESFNFEEGEKIQEGDIIASLVQKDGLLKLKYSEIELKKNQQLFDLGAINTTKLEQAKLEYESAKSDLDKTNIYAVSNGFLGARMMDAGSYATPNDKAGTFVSLDKVYAEFNVIEKDSPKVALGQKVEVFVDAYPNKSYSGAIDRVSPIIEGRSRTQTVKVEIDNKDELLKPGMFTRGSIATYEKKEALVIPASALKKKEPDYFIYVIHKEEAKKEAPPEVKKELDKTKATLDIFKGKKKDEKPAAPEPPKPATKEKEAEYGSIEVRKIKLGYMTQDLVEIDEGLKEDEFIVIEIQEEMKDKAKVEITEVQEGLF
ncbi:MAG: efflux RND transporter periplasmic adaptor subunit [Candidatus Omnitrophota bacterium]|jgi:membrane fusion protein (multidrug efflux system)